MLHTGSITYMVTSENGKSMESWKAESEKLQKKYELLTEAARQNILCFFVCEGVALMGF